MGALIVLIVFLYNTTMIIRKIDIVIVTNRHCNSWCPQLSPTWFPYRQGTGGYEVDSLRRLRGVPLGVHPRHEEHDRKEQAIFLRGSHFGHFVRCYEFRRVASGLRPGESRDVMVRKDAGWKCAKACRRAGATRNTVLVLLTECSLVSIVTHSELQSWMSCITCRMDTAVLLLLISDKQIEGYHTCRRKCIS